MDEGVHVGGVQVRLLVPGGGWQDDVGVGAGGIETEIDVHHQVQLAHRGLFVPLDLPGVGTDNSSTGVPEYSTR